MTPKFEYAFSKTFPWEKGFESAETAAKIHDSGGATMDGISDAGDGVRDGLAKYPRCGIVNVPIQNLTLDQVREIYFVYYWQVCKAEYFEDTRLAALVFDLFFNQYSIGVKLLQRGINLFFPEAMQIAVDGGIGSETIAHANSLVAVSLVNKVVDLRTAHFRKKVPFLQGLVDRSESFRITII